SGRRRHPSRRQYFLRTAIRDHDVVTDDDGTAHAEEVRRAGLVGGPDRGNGAIETPLRRMSGSLLDDVDPRAVVCGGRDGIRATRLRCATGERHRSDAVYINIPATRPAVLPSPRR